MSLTENLTETNQDISQTLTEGLEDAIFDEKPPENFIQNICKEFEMFLDEDLNLF